ncbi:2Fe-2S iron-sulfur cluster-binding protein [Streptomyces sp. NPDC050564]|uniref:2Fe-2S iron-sulfur cluster-binding protein n=1 Tax=Streptomyces sp. NPDC050564 TaxID=3365631 RepID=UPI003791A098
MPTRWSCRTGVCHTCTTRLVSGDVAYTPQPLAPELSSSRSCKRTAGLRARHDCSAPVKRMTWGGGVT